MTPPTQGPMRRCGPRLLLEPSMWRRERQDGDKVVAEDLPPSLRGPQQLALARAADVVPTSAALPGGSLYEPKWDGYRVAVTRNTRCRLRRRHRHAPTAGPAHRRHTDRRRASSCRKNRSAQARHRTPAHPAGQHPWPAVLPPSTLECFSRSKEPVRVTLVDSRPSSSCVRSIRLRTARRGRPRRHTARTAPPRARRGP